MLGSAFDSRKAFREYLEVRRHVKFREQFPDHPTTLMQSDEMVAAVYDEKKSRATVRLQTLGMLTVWPLTLPYMLGTVVFDKVTGINDNMAPKITIDHYKIREEEGR
jgi:hypothetical protein